MKKILLFALIIFGINTLYAQRITKKQPLKVEPVVCYASNHVEKSFIPPPPEFLNRLKSSSSKTAEIEVKYSLFPDTAIQAFEYAVSIWEHVIQSPITIRVQANWRTQEKNVLGSCGPDDYKKFEGAPADNVYYPIALFEKLTKSEVTGPGVPDMTATFNKDVKWYFGTDGNTPDSLYDFVSVVMHEIGHGLGFTGFFFKTSGDVGAYGNTNWGDLAIFDTYIEKGNGNKLTDTTLYPNRSDELLTALTSGDLYSNSPAARADAGPARPKLYAPLEWDGGSSVYHLNDASYQAGNPNSLMTHAVGKGEAIHDPGPITNGIMADLGWKYMYINFDPVKDKEQIEPLVFNMTLESEYDIDSTSLFLISSTDSFKTSPDTLPFTIGQDVNQLTATLNPPADIKEIYYYITAGDVKNRTFTKPYRAPQNFYTLKFGPDNEKPVIVHRAIPYFLQLTDKLNLTAQVDDNQGLDTTYVEYTLNGGPVQTFGLTQNTGINYTGLFPFDYNNLSDGDLIKYRIIARDKSTSQNTRTLPETDWLSFKIEQLFEPVIGYFNDFDSPTSDFIISDFDIYTAPGFSNPSLHSPHPYLSSQNNDITWDYTTLLKRPVILKTNGTMSFDEIVLVEPSQNSQTKFGDENFWDYVIVEGSKDNGVTWLPLLDGYDSRANITWRGNYELNIVDDKSTAVGIPDWYVTREFNLLENGNFAAGDTILIRFRLFSDPFSTGWGWTIDNLRIQSTVSSPAILTSRNISIYPNPFKNIVNVSVQANKKGDNLEIELYDLFGQKIYSEQKNNLFGNYNSVLNLGNFSNGFYILTVKENGEMVYSQKIIKTQ